MVGADSCLVEEVKGGGGLVVKGEAGGTGCVAVGLVGLVVKGEVGGTGWVALGLVGLVGKVEVG